MRSDAIILQRHKPEREIPLLAAHSPPEDGYRNLAANNIALLNTTQRESTHSYTSRLWHDWIRHLTEQFESNGFVAEVTAQLWCQRKRELILQRRRGRICGWWMCDHCSERQCLVSKLEATGKTQNSRIVVEILHCDLKHSNSTGKTILTTCE